MEAIIQEFNNKFSKATNEKLTAYEKKELIRKLRTEFPLEFTPNETKQKKIIKIANKALMGDLYFDKYIDYIIWIRNALAVTQ